MASSTLLSHAYSADEAEEEQLLLLLSPDQAELIESFRRDVRHCETEEEKLRLCAEARSRLLEQYTQVELLIALFERVMLAECAHYRKYKRTRTEAGKILLDAQDEWGRFIARKEKLRWRRIEAGLGLPTERICWN